MSTASWTSASLAPAPFARPRHRLPSARADRDERSERCAAAPASSPSKPSDDPRLTSSTSGTSSAAPPRSSSACREGAVRIHAEEAVVRGRDRGRQHLALVALERRAGEVVDEQRVGEAAEVHAKRRRQHCSHADARVVGQPADDRLLPRPFEPGALQVVLVARSMPRSMPTGPPREASLAILPRMTARTLTIGGGTYPVVLPNIRDPRLHVAAVVLTVHALGQVGLHFWVSVPADPRRDRDVLRPRGGDHLLPDEDASSGPPARCSPAARSP